MSLGEPISCSVKDRLSENKLALKFLDRLSNAHPASSKKFIYGRKKGHGHKIASGSTSYDALSILETPGGLSTSFPHGHSHHKDAVEVTEKNHLHDHAKIKEKRRRRKTMTNVILDQLGDAIGAVALKNSKFNQQGEFGSLHSARKLARKLFSALSDVHPPRNLIVSGAQWSDHL